MKGQMEIYYDEEGDYLEIFIKDPSPNYGEDINDEVMIFRDERTEEVVGIAIQDFKKRTKNLKDISVNLPFSVNFEEIHKHQA